MKWIISCLCIEKNVFANAPKYYVIFTLPILLQAAVKCSDCPQKIHHEISINFFFTWENEEFRHSSKFDVHESMLRDTNVKVTNKMQLYRLIYFYFSLSTLHVFGNVFAHHQEHMTVFTESGRIHPNCCRLRSWLIWNCSRAGSNLNTTRYCKYSQVLLIMGEKNDGNM
jgi:hypothetical protein